MTDVSGIPNMGFGGGGYFGGIPNQQPAMSADQINASMWGRYSPQQAQHTLNNIYGPGGFGAQPAHYAGLGAAYGRATGGFGGAPGRLGTIGNPFRGGVPQGPANPSGSVQRGGPLPAPPSQAPLPQGRPFQPAMTSAARSPFTGLGFGGNRDYLAAIMRNNASPRPPALHSQNPAAANSFLQAYQNQSPQSQINNRFGSMQPPVWSAPGITLADKLRQQQPSQPGWSEFDNQGQRYFIGQ